MNHITRLATHSSLNQQALAEQTENDMLQLAISKVKQNLLDEAITLFKTLVNSNGKHAAAARVHLMNTYKQIKDSENTIKAAKHILEHEVSNLAATLVLIDAALSEKNYNEALSYCDVYEKHAKNKTIQLRNAHVRRLVKDYAGSKKILITILAETPEEPAALLQLSHVYLDSGEFETAFVTAQKIPNSAREYSAAVIISIDCLIKLEQTLKALEIIEHHLTQGTATTQILHRQFSVLKKLDRHDQAKDLIDRTELTEEQRARMAFDLVKFYKTQSNLTEIEFCLNKIAALNEKSEVSRTLYAESLYILNKQQQLFEFTEKALAVNPPTDKLKMLHYKAKQLCLPKNVLKEDKHLLQENSDELFNIYTDTLILTGEITEAYKLLTQRLATTTPTAVTLQATFNLLCQLKLYEKAVEFITNFKEGIHFLCKARVGYLLHVLYLQKQTTNLQQLLALLETEKNDIFYPQILWVYAFMGQPEKAERYFKNQLTNAESNNEKIKTIQREAQAYFNWQQGTGLTTTNYALNSPTSTEPFAITYLNELLAQNQEGYNLLTPLELAVPKKLTQQANETDITWYSKACRGATAYQLYSNLVSRDYTVNKILTNQLSHNSAAAFEKLAKQQSPCVFVSTHFGAPGTLAVLTEQIEKSLYLINPYVQYATKNPLTEKAIAVDGSLENIRQLKSKIKAGYSLIGALDQRPEFASTKPITNTISVNVFGYNIEFSSLLPRMIWNNQLPNVWAQVRFNNGKAEFYLADLPQVADFDDQTAWQQAWLQACAVQIEQLLMHDSDNCVPTAPLWKQLFDQVFANSVKEIAELPLPKKS